MGLTEPSLNVKLKKFALLSVLSVILVPCEHMKFFFFAGFTLSGVQFASLLARWSEMAQWKTFPCSFQLCLSQQTMIYGIINVCHCKC